MRKTLLIILAIFSFSYLQAQTVVFSESFEGSTLQVTSSTTNTGTPANAWGLSSTLHYQGSKSDSCVVTTGDTTWLTTNAFSTTGNTFVMLNFAQICKIAFTDKAIIEVSGNNGVTWTQLVASQYLGTGQFATNTNSFNDVSYLTDWSPFTNTVPLNTWWKNETFDISSIAANQSQVKIRFALIDAGLSGSEGRYGWLLDSIVVTAALSELSPPVISYVQPMLIDSVYNFGPFVIQANITDVSGVDTAMLIYNRNGGPDQTIGMTQAGTLFQGVIDTFPSFSVGDTVCYRIYAKDASASGNYTTNPILGCNQFVIYTSPPPPGCTTPITSFPYIQDFESGTAGTGTPSSPGTLPTGWTRTPNSGSNIYMHLVKTGSTSSYSTGPTGDHTSGSGKYVYGEVSYGSSGQIAYTKSPCMNLTNVSAPQLEFWYHMYGTQIGTLTVQIYYGGQWIDAWTKTGNQGNQWNKGVVNLMPYKSITQIRFKSNSLGCCEGDIAFDDVKVWVPPANDAGVVELQKPTSPALSGTIPVKIGVKNFGSANLTTVKIDWQVNGVSQSQYTWNGTLPPMTTMDSIQIGTYTFTAGAPTLKFWTSNPNNSTDGFTYNDTLLTSVVVCDGYLHGTYTVGTATSDFSDIGSAVSALNNCGIDSTVVFNVAASTYTGQLVFGAINGASSTNTITFKGQGASTIIQATPNSADQDIVRFNGGMHIILDSLTIQSTGSPTHAVGIRVMNNSDSNTVRNCRIIVPSVTSSYYNGFIFSNSLTSYSTQCNSAYWTIENNYISGGYYALSLRGTTSYPKANKVINNEITAYYYYGIYSYYQDSIQIIGNYVHDNIHSYGYGIYTYYNKNGVRVERNKIKLSTQSSEYGMYLYYMNYGASNADTCIVANNMISLTTATSNIYGMYVYQANRVKIVYNSINITSGSAYTRGIYQYSGTGLVIKNNNIVNTGGGYTLYINTATAIVESDYNNLYATGSYLAYWGGNRPNLSALQTASGKDANSVSGNPSFISSADLHTAAILLYGAGDAVTDILDDYDGDARANPPCIGADEFMLLGDDAGILSLTSPIVTCPGDTANVIVELRNYGIDTLFTATISWKIDGVAQTSYSYSDTLLPGQSENIQLGTYIFTSGVGHDMDFWTSMPNGIVDLQPSNDSLFITNFKTAIPGGTYTIGGTGADYPSMAAVVTDLNAYGICGPVVFKVNSGTYTDHIAFGGLINGASSINTITFTSATNDSSTVIINHTPVSGNLAAIVFNGASYITVKNLTFNVNGTTTGRGIALFAGSSHNTFKSCVFNMPAATSSSIVGIYITSATIKYNTFSNNKITNCYYGAYVRGSSSTSLGKGNILDNNIFDGFYSYGIYAQYQDSIMIRNNIIMDGSTAAYPRGIYSYYCDGAKQITGNTIKLTPTTYAYGMYVYYSDATASAKGIIANNMISITTGLATSTNYGIYCYYSTHQQFYHNSLNITVGGVNTRGIYVYQGNNIDLVNNIFSIPNGYTLYVSTAAAVNTSDYNDLYSNATNMAYWTGNRTSLSALKSASGKDAHSMDVNPNFYQPGNLHLITSPVDGQATPLTEVTIDIDGELRDTLTPDIGADEFTPPAQDITVLSVEYPEINNCGLTYVDVTAKVFNSGSDTIMGNLVLKYSVDSGATYVSETITTIIPPTDTLVYTFSTQANITTSYDKYFGVWVVGALPLDPITLNDTAKIVIFNGMIPAVPTVTNTSSVYATTAAISASSSNLILWFDSVNAVTPLGIGTSYTTSVLFATRDYYAVTQASNGCRSAYTPLTVTVTGIPAGDVGISAILVNEGCGMDSNEVITIEVYNQGTATVSTGLTATYKVDNNAWVTAETISTSIASGATIQYSFTATANLYALMDTMFDITAVVTLTGDPYHVNDTLTRDSVEALYTPQDPIVSSPLNISYGAIANLSATSSDSLFWFKTFLDSIPFANGATTSTSNLWADTTFYVQAGASSGSADSISTLFLGGNGQTGNMFDITAINAISLDSFVVSPQSSGTFTVEVYYKQATYVGSETNSSAWTLLGSASVVSTGSGAGNKVVAAIGGLTIPAGQTYGIYVTLTTGSVNYTNGNGSNQAYSDVNMSISLGAGKSYPFGSTFTPRVWNGMIYYSLGSGGGSCVSNRIPLLVDVAPPPPLDAGMESFVSPIGSTPSATPTPIIVKIKNYGTSPLTAVNITYELNGSIKGTYAWTGSVVFNAISAPITIYNDTFPGGLHTMRAWVSNANGSPTAGVNANDTIGQSLSACLNGAYTVGDSTSDFATIGDALTALDSAGICGHVVFNIVPGTYNTQMALMPITGMDTANTVTFQSSTGDSTDVVIEATPAGATTSYTLIFYGGNYYTIRNLTLKSMGSYGHTVVYYNSASYNTIENCIIESPSGASSSSSPVYSNASTGDFNTIRNSHIKNGHYSLYLRGSSTANREHGFVLDNNIIENFYYYGIYSYYTDSLIVNNNIIKGGNATYNYPRAMNCYYGGNKSEVIANKITLQPSVYGYGMYFYQWNGGSTSGNIIANNMITIDGGTSTNYGIYSYYSSYMGYYHNSVNMIGGNSSSRAIYIYQGTSGSIDVMDNIFHVDGLGYAYYVNTPTAISSSDYNDIYTTGTNYAYWSGYKASLSALKTASGKDAHSLEVPPMFYADDDLHSGSVDINDAGYPIAEVPRDFDGELRSTTTPDIGADEFTPPPNDASMVSLDYPVAPVTVGSNPVHVSMRNFGADTLISASIAWEVNSVSQTSFAWSGSLPTGTQADSINIGSYTFGAGATSLKFWPTNPNNGVDGNHLNDTLEVTLIGCLGALHGTYTIGGTTADYPNFASALMAIQYCGIDSHVVFNVNAGSYNEQLHFVPIPGAGDTATVTFQSTSADSTDVLLSYSTSSNANYTVFLDGADYISFKHMTIESQGSNSRTIVLASGANHNSFIGNILKAGTSTSSVAAVIYSSGSDDEFNTFRHNKIMNSYQGVYMRGPSTSNGASANVFEYNEITGFYYYGLYLYYQDSVEVRHNYIHGGGNNYQYGMFLYYCNKGFDVGYNTIELAPIYTGYGARIYNSNATYAKHARFYNNFISITSGSSSHYAMYCYQSSYVDYTYNNINITSGGSYSRGLYLYYGSNNTLLNNSIANVAGGYVLYVYPTAVSNSDHNNFYSTGSNFAYWNGNKSNLAALQAGSSMDSNSVSVDPGYYSTSNLHVTNVVLHASGVSIPGITDDYDGDLRANPPCIGADEFTPQPWDAAVVAFNTPKGTYAAQGTSQTVYARVRNFGTNTITTMNVGYVYGSGTPSSQTWTGILLPGDTASVLFTTGFTTLIGTEMLKAYTMLPLDGDSTNDTLSMAFAGLPLIAPTYCDGFDGQNIWATPGSEWQRGIPQGTSINAAHSAPNVWMTRLSGDYSSNAHEYLLSPFFDFSSVTNGSTLKFWRNNKFASNDGLSVDYSTDGGNTWITLGYMGDPLGTNWYTGQTGGTHMFMSSSSGWTHSTYNLAQFNQVTTPIQFRMHLITNASGTDEGVAIDDFCIELPPIPNDVGVISIDAPVDSTQIGLSNNIVTVSVKNFGTATQTSIPVFYKIGTGTAVAGTITITAGLAPGDTVQYTFTQQFQSPGNDYTLCAYTALSGDIYNSNDQTCENIRATAAAIDAGVSLIISPQDTAPLWTLNTVTVRIKNYGTSPLSTCDVQYKINTSPTIETWTGTALQMGDSVDFTFTATYNSPVGYYQVCAKTLLANDADPLNDEVCKTVLADGFEEHLENGMKLWQNVPNPAHGITMIDYEIPSSGQIRFELVDVLGQSVMLQEQKQTAGRHQVRIDASKLASGIYYYTIEFDGYRLTKKMIVNK